MKLFSQLSKFLALVGFWGGLVSLPLGSARADQVTDLQSKVDHLIATNQKNYQDVAQAVNSMNEIRQEVRSVQGTLESSDYLRKESERVYQDLDQRVTGLEDRIAQVQNLLKDLNVKLAAQSAGAEKLPAASASSQEVADFQALLNLTNARDYRNAASGFMGFLKKYPASELNGSAQYWVAESFYSMGDYAKAISEFQALATKYPQHERVKEAVYKQGLSFQKLGKPAEAKLFYQKALSAYSGSAEAYLAQGRLMRLEEMEKNSPNVALSPKVAATPSPPSVPEAAGEPSANKPLMKPAPMPRAPLPRATPAPVPAPAAPAPKPKAPTSLPPDAAQESSGSSSAPLF